MLNSEESFGKCLEKIRSVEYENYYNKLEFAQLLYNIKKNKLYKISHQYWNDFLKDIGVPYGEAYNMLKTRNILEKYNMLGKQLPIRVVKLLIKVINNDNADDLLSKAQSLPYVEFLNEVNMIKDNLKSSVECEHNETETWEKCKKCGKWLHQKTA